MGFALEYCFKTSRGMVDADAVTARLSGTGVKGGVTSAISLVFSICVIVVGIFYLTSL